MKINARWFSLLIALYFGLVLNITVFYKLYFIFQNLESVKPGLVFSIPLLFVAVLNIIVTIITIKYIEKPLIIFWLITSAIVSYQMFYYGIVFDTDMFVNIFETNTGESWSFVNFHILTWVLILGGIPAYFVWRCEILYQPFFKEVGSKLVSIVVSIMVLGVIYFMYYKDISSIARNNRHLRTALVPSYYTNGLVRYIQQTYFKENIPYKQQGLDAKVARKNKRKNNLIIVAVGETARSMNYQWNGYTKDTNRYTKNDDIVFFKNVTSCGTATALSLPCMFSSLTRREYKHDYAVNQDNLIDILKRAGVNMLWIDNDNGCKGVCSNIKYVKLKTTKDKWCDGLYCIDEVLVEKAEDELAQLPQGDTIVFLHLIGSHGPTYYLRYPDSHRLYTPDCQRSDIQNCTHEELVNTYDNTIAYTDYVLSKLIELLKTKKENMNTALVYLSDHGESLGEYGMYLHGTPYFMAPKEQTSIPMMMWFSNSFVNENKINLKSLKRKAEKNNYSHDNFFHTMLGLTEVKTSVYDNNLDIFNEGKYL